MKKNNNCYILFSINRLLDLGFEKDIAVILNALNAANVKRQNILLSATLTDGEMFVVVQK